MPRPRRRRRINFQANVNFFKPAGIRVRDLQMVSLDLEEVEALRLKNIKNLDQNKCAKEMNISQSTFQRILSSAYKKISQAIINGWAIEIKQDTN